MSGFHFSSNLVSACKSVTTAITKTPMSKICQSSHLQTEFLIGGPIPNQTTTQKKRPAHSLNVEDNLDS